MIRDRSLFMIACVCISMAPIVGSLTEYSLKYSGRVPHHFSGKGKAHLYGGRRHREQRLWHVHRVDSYLNF